MHHLNPSFTPQLYTSSTTPTQPTTTWLSTFWPQQGCDLYVPRMKLCTLLSPPLIRLSKCNPSATKHGKISGLCLWPRQRVTVGTTQNLMYLSPRFMKLLRRKSSASKKDNTTRRQAIFIVDSDKILIHSKGEELVWDDERVLRFHPMYVSHLFQFYFCTTTLRPNPLPYALCPKL